MSDGNFGATSLRVRAMPDPGGWRVEHLVRGCIYAMAPDEAEATGRALIAAAAEAKAKMNAEHALSLAERVRLFLARLCYMTPKRIADGLGAAEADVRAALDELALAGRVRSLAPEHPCLYEALDRSGAWPEDA